MTRPTSHALGRRMLSLGALAAASAALFATLIPFAGALHWALDLLTHLRPHLALASTAVLAVALVAQSRSAAATCLAALSLNAVVLAPDLRPPLVPLATDPDRPQLEILMANVLTANPDPDRLKRLIHHESPDVIGLLEVDDEWVESLRYLRGRYPHHVEDPRSDNFGIALLSRVPLDDARIEPLGGDGLNAIRATITLEGRSIDIVLAHPVPPAGRVYSTIRNAQLDALTVIREGSTADEFVLVGDLNTTPWSPHFARLVERTGLRLAARGHGFAPTWPTTLPGALRIPIDHTLLSPGLLAIAHRVGPEIGSDHLPIVTRIGLR